MTPPNGNPPSRGLPAHAPGLALADIYYILFCHKWKILLCAAAGVAGAVALYLFDPPNFQSEAKLFVRYVETERKSLGPSSAMETMAKTPDVRGETIMNSEIEILTSTDLIRQVVETVGPAKILAKAGGGSDAGRAVGLVKANLQVDVAPKSSVIRIVFSHPDAGVLQPVLRETIDRYLKKHLEIHRTAGLIADSLTQETDQLRSRLAQTEDELRQAKAKAGVTSLEEARKSLADQIASIHQQIYSSQAELAERVSVLQQYGRASAAPAAAPADGRPVHAVPLEKSEYYNSLATKIARLRGIDDDLSTQFTDQNAQVVEVREQLAEAENARAKLLGEYPELAGSVAPGAGRNPNPSSSLDLAAESARTIALQAKIKVLGSQFEELRVAASKIEQLDGSISELQRKKELDEANYRYYAATLEQSRINEALGNGRVSNISEIQSPSPPSVDRKKALQRIAGVAVGGLAVGLGWALAIELYFDRTIKRPIDVNRHLGLPLFLSIPALRGGTRRDRRKRLAAATANGDGARSAALATTGTNGHGPAGALAAALPPFCETLRDRLIAYFESQNLTHKPKLVAVTGLGGDAGVTTVAAGLARSLSETGEGNVLLVDMTVGQGAAHQFVKGKEVCEIGEMLDARDSAHVQENLYVVAAGEKSERLSRNLPQRFTKLLPKLKASDFDYIIFDMPVISQISITPRLAGFMDIVLMVLESEKCDRDLVRSAADLLTESKASVGIVLNKTHAYVPSQLQQGVLGLS